MSVGIENNVVQDPAITVVKSGYIKKLKTMKKKFFVLRTETIGERSESRLEYYDSEKKFKNNSCSKRSIPIRSCYVINRRNDTKHKFVIGLYTRLDCFSLVFDLENNMHDWLRLFLSLHTGCELTGDKISKPYWDHAWRVTICKKEKSEKCVNLSGSYLLCLTETSLKFLELPLDESSEVGLKELQLHSVRRCGNLDEVFYMELGQASCFGPGNVWMQTEDATMAEHMNTVIMTACMNIPKSDSQSKSRCRSFSANELSKPINCNNQKLLSSGDGNRSHNHQEHSTNGFGFGSATVCSSSMGDGLHPHIFVSYPPIRRASTGTRPVTCVPVVNGSSGGRVNTSYVGRERCDSFPTTNRALCNGNVNSRLYVPIQSHTRSNSRGSSFSSPNSTYVMAAAGCCPEHAISSNSSNSVNADNDYREPAGIPEENNEEYSQWVPSVPHLPGCPLRNKGVRDASSSHGSNLGCTNIGDRCNSQTSCSSNGSSPLDSGAAVAYSTSQGSSNDIRNDNFNRSLESVDHSRESSIHDESGYMIMAPTSSDTGYNSIETNHHCGGELSPGLSSCSITWGTPSTDARLSEHHVRPVRAYSIGSKPDGRQTQMNRWDYDSFRVRACSVGSHSLHQNRSNAASSSPIRTCNSTSTSTSTSSVEPDMVEFDFSANKWRHKAICLRRNSGAGATNNQMMEKSSYHAISSSSASSASSLSAGSGAGSMDASSRSSPKCDCFVKDASLSSKAAHNKYPFGAGRSPPRNGCSSTFSKASPPIAISYLSPKLERVVERTPLSSRETNICCSREYITNKSNPESSSSSDILDCGGGGGYTDEAYMDMKPTVFELDNNSGNCCSCYSDMDLSSSNSEFAANGVTCRADEQQQIVFVPRPTGSKRSDGVLEYLDMSFGSSRQNAVDASTFASCSDSSAIEAGNKDDTLITDEDETGRRTKEEDDKENNETDQQRQCSEPIAIVKGNDNTSAVGKRGSSASAFFKRKSVCKHPSHQKLSFLALNIPIPSSFTPSGWKKKNSKRTGEKHDTSGSSSTASVSSGSNHTIFPLSPESVPPAQPFKTSESKRTTSDKSIGTDSLLKNVCRCHCSTSFSEQTYWSPRPSSSSAASSCTDTRCSLGNPEDSVYPVVIPAHVTKGQRKISEPSAIGKSNTKIRNVVKQDKTGSAVVVPINPKKILLRSTSVPDEVSSMAKSDDKAEEGTVASSDIDQRMSSLNLKNTRDCNGSADEPISMKQSNDNDDCYVSFAPFNSNGSEFKNEDVLNAAPNVHRYEKIVRNNCETSEYATVGIMNDCSEYVEISFDKKKPVT